MNKQSIEDLQMGNKQKTFYLTNREENTNLDDTIFHSSDDPKVKYYNIR